VVGAFWAVRAYAGGGGNRRRAEGVLPCVQREVLPLGRSGEERDGRRPRLPVRVRVIGAALVVLNLTTVYWLAVRSMSGPWLAAGSTTPLHTIRADLALGPAGAVWHLGGALLALAPLGVSLPLVGGRVDVWGPTSFARSAFCGLMLAFGAELIRTGFAGQIFDVDVVVLNTVGVALAHLAVVPAARAALRRRCVPAPAVEQPSAPTPATVGATP
jgi:glycopeptide antibiotics resistance protein